MALDDLETLREQLPDIFKNQHLPTGWEEDWLVIPVDDLEAAEPPKADYEGRSPQDPLNTDSGTRYPGSPNETVFPDFHGAPSFPGSPQSQWGEYLPPPDALAFYLPFHYFHPTWWGVYLILEGVHWLAGRIEKYSGGTVWGSDAIVVARLFLYGHEAFHHSVESFAARLEITHRAPLYRLPFESYYRDRIGTRECLEEALTSAYGYRKVKERAFKSPEDPNKRDSALHALEQYIKACPPGYDRALEFVETNFFLRGREDFAEENHRFALPGIPGRDSAIWRSAPHAFSGISRVTSRINYLVNRASRLAHRHGLGLRYLSYRDLSKRLKQAGCTPVREGRRHQVWAAPNGQTFPVPRHPGDLRKGTLAKIIKQAGLDMSISQFIQSAVTG